MSLKSNFNIVVWNAQSINNKHNLISHFLDTHHPSILAITESHFSFNSNSLSLLYTENPNYICISYPHTRARSAGTVFFIHSSVQFIPRLDLRLDPSKITSNKQPSTLHWFELKISAIPTPILLGITYIHPNSTSHDLKQISNNITHTHTIAHNNNASVLLAGDFNQHCEEWGQTSTIHTASPILYNSLTNCNLHNLNFIYQNNQPTHQKSVIDLAFTDSPNIISNFQIASSLPLLSDHKPLLITLHSTLSLLS